MIRSRALTYRYAQGPALAFADVDLAPGEHLLLRGNSGSGKSTWLALVAGLLTPASGELSVAGTDLVALAGARRDAWRARHVGLLPQQLHLTPALCVADNLGLVFFAAGLARDDVAIAQALKALGLAELAQRKPQQLSGGQAQRVALARAVLLTPQVILADEPTASLDDDAALVAVGLLRDCAQRCGATLVIATHDARVQSALPHAKVLRPLVPGEVA